MSLLTAAEINALPDQVRQYIHDLETRCDPAGDIQRIAAQDMIIDQLLAECQRQRATIEMVRTTLDAIDKMHPLPRLVTTNETAVIPSRTPDLLWYPSIDVKA